jgi:hypothetical protein
MNAGASFIVEIILPTAATTVGRGSDRNSTFRYFTNLRKAEGNVTDIGAYAFTGLTRLTTASFPEVTNIGGNAFSYYGGLTTVSFPEADSIGEYAFYECNRLTSITLGTIIPSNFDSRGGSTFESLRNAYYQQPEGQRAGRYTRSGSNGNWSKR